ncbi:MAG TPA: hypothetical protein VMS95_04165 [Candidatus Krumholzibacteriaceae bacterium]|nr:hypothetical protein [Candidatus Krumholzibacteriaceae bacterium]
MPFWVNSVLLKVGSLGYFLGFVSWVFWALVTFVSFTVATGPSTGLLPMSGIFFQSHILAVEFYSLLWLSFLLGAIGCFGFWKKLSSGLAFACGVVFAFTFASTLLPGSGFLIGSLFFFPQFQLAFFGLILWGVTLLTFAGKLASRWQGKVAGVFFVVAGSFGLLAFGAIAYFGFEIWLLMFGWLYAAAAFLTALILYKMS